MPRKARQVLASLKAKGFFEDREGHHIFLIYETKEVTGQKFVRASAINLAAATSAMACSAPWRAK